MSSIAADFDCSCCASTEASSEDLTSLEYGPWLTLSWSKDNFHVADAEGIFHCTDHEFVELCIHTHGGNLNRCGLARPLTNYSATEISECPYTHSGDEP